MPHISWFSSCCAGHHTNVNSPELHRSAANFENVARSFEEVLEMADNWYELPVNARANVTIYNLIYYYATEVYGRTVLKRWLNANRNMSLLDKINPNDMAYALLVVSNYEGKWQAELQDETDEELSKQINEEAAKSNGSDKSPPKKKRKYPMKYTKPSAQRLAYLETGWNTEGLKRFEELLRVFTSLREHGVAWQACKDGWDSYIEDKRQDDDIHPCWVPTYRRLDDNDDRAEKENSADRDEQQGFEFVLPNDDIPSLPDFQTSAAYLGCVVQQDGV